ncbi:MAG: prepilin-type N-terminal cleavage/methylation domain-containing protein, partial [Elusimicrobia bacterium]|nr:prepilin-type N-terminal cleavage/methylation domain-containing protein [Elusimicrobiota bacterium]
MNLRGRCGFSLLELLVALALSSLVLVGVMMLATSMVKFQMDSIEQGSGTGGAVYAVQRLKKDLADATDLECPGSRCAATGHSNRGDVLAACTNWSVLGDPAAGGQRIDDNAPNETDCQSGSGNVKCFYYCVA